MKKYTKKQLLEDIEFLRIRAKTTGCFVSDPFRSWGMSSNSLVNAAYDTSVKQVLLPWDKYDLDACIRAFSLLPMHRQTRRVKKFLQMQKKAVKV